ncbi:MBL fold metallo-hydrolase [Nocardia halotolerans]|uniref:MBL fold metallo-hydrolase n=1 Tax=Nocardia halotolerans TaxID=1755878 RepID=A0ABV8VHN5_9NOCA
MPAVGVIEGAPPWRRLRTSLTTYVVQHPEATFLVDPAYCRDARNKALKEHPWLVRKVATPPAATIATVDSLLATRFRPDFALPTHAHWDHVCGLLDMPELPVYLRGIEKDWVLGSERPPVGGVRTALTDGRSVVTYDLDGPPVASFAASHDLFGDSSVLLVDLPGHTPGSIGVLARTPSGWVLIAGDAAWHYEQIDRIRQKPSFPGGLAQVDFDRDAAFSTLHRLHLARHLMRLIPTHDHDASQHLSSSAEPPL